MNQRSTERSGVYLHCFTFGSADYFVIHYFSYSLSSDFKDHFFNQAKQRSAVADNDSPLHL